jgi:hypothetical protein
MDEVGLSLRLGRDLATRFCRQGRWHWDLARASICYTFVEASSYLHYRAMLCYGEVMFPLLIVQAGQQRRGREARRPLIVEMSLVVSYESCRISSARSEFPKKKHL